MTTKTEQIDAPEVYSCETPTVELYLAKSGERWVDLNSEEPAIGKNKLTRMLNLRYDSRPSHKRGVRVGERLFYHQKLDGESRHTSRVIPTEWVVTKVVHYEASDLSELPEFAEAIIAYCERQPLPPEEVEALSYDVVSRVSADSFGGDVERYREFLATPEAAGYDCAPIPEVSGGETI